MKRNETWVNVCLWLFSIMLLVVMVIAAIPAYAGPKVTLELTTWLSGEQLNSVKGSIERFEKANPGIEVKLIQIPCSSYPEYQSKVITLLAGKGGPDLIHTVVDEADTFIDGGLLYDVAPFLKESGFDYSKYLPFSPVYKRGDYVWGGLETHCAYYPLYYNVDLFEEAALESPMDYYRRNAWDWRNFVAAARKLTVDKNGDGRTDRWGFLFTPLRHQAWSHFLLVNDADFADISKGKMALDTPNARTALEFCQDLIFKEKVAPIWGDPDIGDFTAFARGKAAMMISGSFDVVVNNRICRGTGVRYAAAIPPIQKVKRFRFSPGAQALVTSQTKHPKEAWKFIEYLLSQENQTAWAKERYTVPMNLEALKAWCTGSPPGLEVVFEMSKYFVPDPIFPGSMGLNDVDATANLFSGQWSVERFISELAARGNALFKQAEKGGWKPRG